MKKLLRLGLCLGVLAAALTCTALAAGTSTPGSTTANDGYTVIENPDGSYTAAYTGAKEGEQYALLVVRQDADGGYSVSEESIMYIDQKPAGANGVSFDFIPKSTPDCVVLLGGLFDGEGGSPVTLGTLKGKGVSMSGSVTSYHTGNPVTLTLYQAGTETVAATAAIAAQSGSGQVTQAFTLDGVPVGASYDLEIRKAGHTSYRLTGIPVADALELGTLQLVSGDLDGNEFVDILDKNVVLSNGTYNLTTDEAEIKLADVDGNGMIDIMDVNVVLSSDNYNHRAVNEAYGSKGD